MCLNADDCLQGPSELARQTAEFFGDDEAGSSLAKFALTAQNPMRSGSVLHLNLPKEARVHVVFVVPSIS